jgi:LuxR family transcriptional regulator, maltose regulon positive regulatory protein
MMGWLYISWGDVLRDLNNITGALSYIQQGIEFSEQSNDAAMIGSSHLSLGRILFIKDDLAGAEAVIEKMENLAQKSDMPLYVVDPLEALKVRIWLQKGNLKPAVQWMQDREVRENGKYTLLQESKQILFSRILFAHGEVAESLEWFQKLIKIAEADGRNISVIEMLLVQANALKSKGDIKAAISSVKKAISLANPGGFISIFVEEGPSIAELLQIMLDENADIPRAYVKKILSAFRLTKLIQTDDSIVERLSERELEVLRLIVAGLPNKIIMEELFISMSTVKTHVRNIYSKLNVNSRIQAAAKAKELDILY